MTNEKGFLVRVPFYFYVENLAAGGSIGRTLEESLDLKNPNSCTRICCTVFNSMRFMRFPWRIYPGGLALSRSFGDAEIKRHGALICEPEVTFVSSSVHEQDLMSLASH